MPLLVLLASFWVQIYVSMWTRYNFPSVFMISRLMFDYASIRFTHLKWRGGMFDEIEKFLTSLRLCVIFSSISQSRHERFLGTFEGIGSCHCCKWHWWYSPMYLLRLWYCWCSMGYNGLSGVLTVNFNFYWFQTQFLIYFLPLLMNS